MIDEWQNVINVCRRGWQSGLPETRCGGGSTLENSKNLIEYINTIIEKYNIKSILDVGCGDFNWMKEVKNIDNLFYTGVDIYFWKDMKPLETEKRKFIEANAALIDLPSADLIICRDVMIHLDNNLALKLLNNILKTILYGIDNYILITSFDVKDNNRKLRNYAPINMELEPFNMKYPIEKFHMNKNKYTLLYKYPIDNVRSVR